jgi:hypothetical protein
MKSPMKDLASRASKFRGQSTEKNRGKVILIGSEYVGRGDDTLGFEILMSFLDAVARRPDKPKAVVFWNTAVNLLAQGAPTVGRLKVLEDQGIPILAGRLCLQDLGIADKVAVGKAATMDEILDLILHNEVVSL